MPAVPNSMDYNTIQIPVEVIQGLKKCLISVSQDLTNPERSNVTWNIKGSEVQIFTTDARSISYFKYELDKEVGQEYQFIVPFFFCKQLVSLYQNYVEEDEETGEAFVTFHIGDDDVVAELGKDCQMFTRLIGVREFTDYESIVKRYVPSMSKVAFSSIPSALPPALERASLLLSAQKDNNTAAVNVSGEEFEVLTETSLGRSFDIITFPNDLGEFSFSMDPSLLQRAFKVTSRISILPNVIVLSGSEGNYVHLIGHTQ